MFNNNFKSILIVAVSILLTSTVTFAKPKGYFINPRVLGGAGINIGGEDVFTNQLAADVGLDLLFNISGPNKLNVSTGLRAGYTLMGEIFNRDIDYFQIALIGEMEYRNFIFQFGAGPYISLGNHNTQFGFLLGVGYDIMITDFLSIPILVRSDFLESNQISVIGQIGVGLYF